MEKRDQNMLLLAGAGVGGYLLLRDGSKSNAAVKSLLEQAEYALRSGLFAGDLVKAGELTLAALVAMVTLWEKVRDNLDFASWIQLQHKLVSEQNPLYLLDSAHYSIRLRKAAFKQSKTKTNRKLLEDAIGDALGLLKRTLDFVNKHDMGSSIWSRIFGFVEKTWNTLRDLAKFIVKAPGRIFTALKWGAIGLGGYIAYTLVKTGKLPKVPKLLSK